MVHLTFAEDDYFQTRTRLRRFLAPIVDQEVAFVKAVQQKRTPFWDLYNRAWSIAGGHNSYMIGIPLLFWFGCSHFARHAMMFMTFGLVLCNILKDYFCLPRPASPPVIRLSESHNLEYGFPSSHSVNALNFPLLMAYYYFIHYESSSNLEAAVVLGSLAFMAFSVSFSRIYCGMHCPTDIIGGFIVGAILFLTWFIYFQEIDNWIMDGENVFFYILSVVAILLWTYPNPVSATPSFDDSLSITFAYIGIIFGSWGMASDPTHPHTPYPGAVVYSFDQLGIFKSILRAIAGVVAILVWRTISKSLCKLVFPPLFKTFDFSPSSPSTPPNEATDSSKGPHKLPRFNADIATRAIVYIGTGWLASEGGARIFQLLGLD